MPPREIPFDTVLGRVLLSVLDRDQVHVGFWGQWRQPKLTVNRVLVHGNANFFRQRDGSFTCDRAVVGQAGQAIHALNERDKPISEAGRRRLHDVLTVAVNAWAVQNGPLFEQAHQARLADQRASLEREIADLEANLREKRAELAAVGS
jgi:hypothetical protein